MKNGLPCFALGLILAAPAVGTPIYSVTDLGSLGAGSTAFSLNSSGAAAGTSWNPQFEQRGVLFGSGAVAADLWAGQANGINDSGAVVGSAYINGQRQAAVWTGGAVTVLGTLGGAESEALAVNSGGMTVGRADTGTAQGRAFRWSGGSMQDLGTVPGGIWSAAYAVNDAGWVAGTAMRSNATFQAVMWTPEMLLLELGTLGGRSSYATAINERGAVAGHSATASGWMHAFLYSGGSMRDLGTLGGGSSYAYGINDSGWVVGYSWPASGADTHAFLWHRGAMSDLNSLISPASGWILLEAYAINNSGQIAGAGLLNGELRAFRLEPEDPSYVHNPEPGTLALIGCGLLSLGLIHRRRSRRG